MAPGCRIECRGAPRRVYDFRGIPRWRVPTHLWRYPMAAASFLRVSRIAVAFFACLLTLVLAPSAARAQAQLRVARLPAVLAHHFTNVPLTVFPRGFDIVASNDTVVLGLWLENTGNQPALNVQAQLQNQPGLTFS